MKIFLPLAILAIAGLSSYTLVLLRPEPESKERTVSPTAVEVVTAIRQTVTLSVKSQGTVAPRTETVLITQVSGMITQISDSLYAGGFFEKGEVLVEIDPSDYEAAAIRAGATLAQARLNLATENAQAEQARQDWEALGNGAPTDLVLRTPQLLDAESRVCSAEADLEKARRDLLRTRVSAPYDGMVNKKSVDVGQHVVAGTRLADIFAIDIAEVRLPIPNRELAYLELPYTYRGKDRREEGPLVYLRAEFGGGEHSWVGRLVRTEGTIDPKSRVLYAIAQVSDPYAETSDPNKPPLQVGMFVEAEIIGNTIEEVVVLPRHALRSRNTVLVVDQNNALETRSVDVIRADEERVFIRDGIEEGERVCLTALEYVVDGMQVKPISVDVPQAEVVAIRKPEEDE